MKHLLIYLSIVLLISVACAPTPATPATSTEAPAAEIVPTESAGPAGTVEEVVAKFGCQACHKMLGRGGDLGPDLEQVGKRLTVDQLRQSIIAPDTVIAEGYPPGVMPQDFAEQMMVKELEILVALLANTEVASGEKPAAVSAAGVNAVTGNKAEDVIAQFGCQACHKILGSGGELGPSLENVGVRLDADQIRQSIIEPNAVITEGFPSGVMPPNFSEQMSDEQLRNICEQTRVYARVEPNDKLRIILAWQKIALLFFYGVALGVWKKQNKFIQILSQNRIPPSGTSCDSLPLYGSCYTKQY